MNMKDEYNSELWIPMISELKDSLKVAQSSWITLVVKVLRDNQKVFDKAEIDINEDYVERAKYALSSFQMTISPALALSHHLISLEDAQIFFPMLTETFCMPNRKKYDSYIKRYDKATASQSQIYCFTNDLAEALVEKEANRLAVSVVIANELTLLLIFLTLIPLAGIFNNESLLNEYIGKSRELINKLSV